MKKIIILSAIVIFTASALLFAGNAINKKGSPLAGGKTITEQAYHKSCMEKSPCDTSKCKNSTGCKMQGDKSKCSGKCGSQCKDMSKCKSASTKCDTTSCKGQMNKGKMKSCCPKNK